MMRPQTMIYGAERLVATELSFTRYDKVVEALGGHGESGKPALVNVEMRKDIGALKGSTYV